MNARRRSQSLPWSFSPIYHAADAPPPALGGGLTTAESRLARQWIHAAKFRSYAHHASARVFTIVHLTSLAAIVTLASVSSCYNVYASVREHGEDDLDIRADARWSVCVAVLNGIIVVVTTIHHYCNVASVMHEHAHAANEYANLARDVQVELVLTRSMRTGMYSSPAEFLRDIKRRLEDIADDEPAIPKFVSKYVVRRIRKNQRAIRTSVFAFADAYEAGSTLSEVSSDATTRDARRSTELPRDARPDRRRPGSMEVPVGGDARRLPEPRLTFA